MCSNAKFKYNRISGNYMYIKIGKSDIEQYKKELAEKNQVMGALL